jgi:hypothetical protein
MIPKFQLLLYDSHVPVATVWFPNSSRYFMIPKFQSLLYDSQIPLATVWFPSSSCYCMIPTSQSLLYDSQIPVATLWFPNSSRCFMIPKFHSLLYDFHVPVATVWFPNSSRYFMIPKLHSLLYDSQVPVATVWFLFKVRPLSSFRIILRTKAKFLNTVKDPVVVTENISLCVANGNYGISYMRKHGEYTEISARAKRDLPVMNESRCWSWGVRNKLYQLFQLFVVCAQ